MFYGSVLERVLLTQPCRGDIYMGSCTHTGGEDGAESEHGLVP